MAGPGSAFLQDMAIVTLVAAVTTLVFHRLRQPVVLGYILAGVIVGPHTPPARFVQDLETIEILGQIGVVFLLFALGLEFNFRKLRRIGGAALTAGLLETSIMFGVGYALGRLFGLPATEAFFLGGIVAISSTVIIVKVLGELNAMSQRWAQLVLGILVVEDVVAILLLTALPTIAVGGLSLASLGATVARLAIFVATALVLGLVVVPRAVGYVAKRTTSEMLIVTVVGLGFGLAILGSFLGFSVALGAFLMGALIAESTVAHDVELRLVPLRDLFSAIFFVSVGMLFDFGALLANLPLVLALIAAVVIGKIVAASFATFLAGEAPATAVRVGTGLAQIGEFSFVIAAAAVASLGTTFPIYEVTVSVAAVTAFTTPLLLRRSDKVYALFARLIPRPLQLYGQLYTRWISRAGPRTEVAAARRRVTSEATHAALYGAAAIAIVVGGAASIHRLGDAIQPYVRAENLVLILGWSLIGLVALPFLLLFQSAVRRSAAALAEAAFPRTDDARAQGLASLVLQRTFLFVGILGLVIVLAIGVSPFAPGALVLTAVAAIVTATAILLYSSAARLQRTVDESLRAVLEEAPEAAATPGHDLAELVREQVSTETEIRRVTLPPSSQSAHRSVRELNLAQRTGATLVGLERHGERVLNPAPGTPLLPGDQLVLVGAPSSLEAAERILMERAPSAAAPRAAPQWSDVAVEPECALDGRTLADAGVRERTGATVVAIVRAGRRFGNPPASARVEAGDTLQAVGTPEQLDLLRELARAGRGDSG